ncbi:hypothetical protein HY090_01830 [Candidatus Kaiserbacteria bacterium]|nr:hypothetical protein [Candidatus Kaiserbacteria bacterium]
MTLTQIIYRAAAVLIAWTPAVVTLLAFFFIMTGQIIWTSNNPEKRKQAGQKLLWGVIALFVIFSLGAIIAVLTQTFFGSSSTLSTQKF